MKKVLRAIGGFFAKIGRWIANTAWIQPLLIVGGIFAIIFSIPYIKRGIEGLIAGNAVDYKLAFYQNSAISLANAGTENDCDLDVLLTALEEEDEDTIKEKFGEKFFLSFAETSCTNCKDCADGYMTFRDKFSSEYKLDKDPDTQQSLPGFKFYSVMSDTLITDKNNKSYDKYAAQVVLEKHGNFFEAIAGQFAEQTDKKGHRYRLLENISDPQTTINSISELQDVSDGIEVPTTFLIDLTGDNFPENGIQVGFITAVIFNYTSLMTEDSTNKVSQARFLRDCWTYSNAFSETGKEVNYYVEGAE